MTDTALLFDSLPSILYGLWNTLWICSLGCVLALMLGLLVAMLRLGLPKPLGWLLRGYVELMRGTPFLVVLFVIYAGGPSIGLRFSAPVSGVLSMGLYGAAYFSEIFRSGFNAIPRGQIEAANMLGLPRRYQLLHIRIPQMMRLVIPPGSNQVVILMKESALLAVISVDELTKTAMQIVNQNYVVMAPYIAVGLLYWLAIELVARGGYWLERRYQHASRNT